MDRNWSQRRVPYKACLISLIIGVCPFLIGFVAPDWLWFSRRENQTDVDGSFGLWEICKDYKCSSNDVLGNDIVEDWFLAVVVFQTLALPFYIISLAMAILQNFTPRRWIRTLHIPTLRHLLHKDSETPEDLAFIAGFLSFLAIIIFMVMTADLVAKGAYYSWGFAMSFTGASIPVIAGVLMCKAHTPTIIPPIHPPEPRVIHTLSHSSSRRTERRPQRQHERQSRR
ncbi:uncharacterized protein LOC131949314 [Physella acuta]|uniref:uncharacterized protein LOC131949314 n=1 Tax=Physella acuta TaxID=109671 RepID=UPI0027DE3315|nr:uncharacterized protein LOC131949314 [Physella acuta]XP_059167124.1 uncharacterized protein LOC131949314 [Physella acuta]